MRRIHKEFHTGIILVDLQKAFNKLDHTVLSQKMECIGFKETVIKLFQSYLSNRDFFVTPKDVFSDAGLINCGLAQGSILGPLPLLIYIYINDLPQALNKTGSYLYADDTCIFYQKKDVEKIKNVLNKESSSLRKWFIENKLSIHFEDDKTKTPKLTKTDHIIWRLFSKTAQYCKIFWMLS